MVAKSTLFIATTVDRASINIYDHLLKKFHWQEVSAPSTSQRILKSQPISDTEESLPPLFMWLVHEPTTHLNYPDQKFLEDFRAQGIEEAAPEIAQILFLSRHAAASGTVSLTVHPVGIPWLDDASFCGGIPGRCTPPSTHIAPLYRAVNALTKVRGLDTTFQTSLEATHHGPFAEIPCCYVEIGSSENEWDNPDAGDIWAACLGTHFCLPAVDATEPEIVEGRIQETIDHRLSVQSRVVVMVVGGGHYVPRQADMARLGPNVFTGHGLATYTLQDHWESDRWRAIILEAVEATRKAYPTERLVCLIDKRAFLEKQRNSITAVLEEAGVSWTYKTTDIKTMVEKAIASTDNVAA
eukprot:gene673-727_t